jgi:predicted  nucleic acid-binding Zn-ribbon protein
MQLRSARLCLDCEEVHDANVCPVCASETFAYMTRWIPAPERRVRPRQETPVDPDDTVRTGPAKAPDPDDTVRVAPHGRAASTPASNRHLLRKGVVGLTAIGLAGWLFRKKR